MYLYDDFVDLLHERGILRNNKFKTSTFTMLKKNGALIQILENLTSFSEGLGLKERLCLVLNNLMEQPTCKNPNCSNRITSLQTTGGLTSLFNLYCCKTCSRFDPSRIEKSKETMLKNYGVTVPYKNSEILKKSKQKHRDNYGGKLYNQQHYTAETFNLLNDSEWLIDQHHKARRPLINIAKELGICNGTLNRYMKMHKISTITTFCSSGEIELRNFIKSILPDCILVNHNIRGIIGRYELDVYIPQLELAFEYNGSYWHSEEKGRGEEYHIRKTKMCGAKGIKLVHISDTEWNQRQEDTQLNIVKIINEASHQIIDI